MKDKINKIFCADSASFLLKLNTNSVDLVLTSPPYDNLRQNKQYDSFYDFEKIAKELFRCLKDGGLIVWVVGDQIIKGSESCTSMKQALFFKENLGLRLHDTMIFAKTSFAHPESIRYHQIWEYMFVFSKGKPKTFNPIKDRKNKYLGTRGASGRKKNGERNRGTSKVTKQYGSRFNIWEYSIGKNHTTKDDIAFDHPAIFPEKLAEDHIITWSNKGDLVLDPFCGSGTTCKAAKKLSRNFIGIDKSKEYCKIAEKRINLV